MRLVMSLPGIFLTGMLSAVTAFAGNAPIPVSTDALGEGLYSIRIGDRRSIFLIGKDGVIATDPLNPEAAAIYREEIAKLTDQPIRYVAYSNSFFDTAAGGQVFKKEGAQFVAQENCAINLNETPNPDVINPDITYTDSYTISMSDVQLELFYFGQSYGTCLSVMIARPANIMLISGLVNPGLPRVPGDPTIANYYLHNLVPFFLAVEALAADLGIEQITGAYVVETDDPTLAPVSLVTEQRVFWETLLDIVETEYNKKTPARLIPKRADMTPLENYAGYDPRHVGIMMRRIYSLYRIGR